MGKRLTQITTRTGDDGTTGLGDGSRTGKDNPRIACLGEVDELNSCIGLLRCEPMDALLASQLLDIQHDLFDLGGEICIPGHTMISETQVARLDALIASYNAGLPRLEEFILPGGSRAAALAHLARTVCRRTERSVVTLARTETVSAGARHYLNRLSDLLFVLSRVLNRHAGQSDVLWQQRKNATS